MTVATQRPLNVLLLVMRSFLADGRLKDAANIARATAPCLRAKPTGKARRPDFATLRDDELAQLREARAAGTGAATDSATEV